MSGIDDNLSCLNNKLLGFSDTFDLKYVMNMILMWNDDNCDWWWLRDRINDIAW